MPNLYRPEFDEPRRHPGFNCDRARLGRQAGCERLGASLWSLPPGRPPTRTTSTSAKRSCCSSSRAARACAHRPAGATSTRGGRRVQGGRGRGAHARQSHRRTRSGCLQFRQAAHRTSCCTRSPGRWRVRAAPGGRRPVCPVPRGRRRRLLGRRAGARALGGRGAELVGRRRHGPWRRGCRRPAAARAEGEAPSRRRRTHRRGRTCRSGSSRPPPCRAAGSRHARQSTIPSLRE